jgi:hypothetical protein
VAETGNRHVRRGRAALAIVAGALMLGGLTAGMTNQGSVHAQAAPTATPTAQTGARPRPRRDREAWGSRLSKLLLVLGIVLTSSV